MTLRKSLVVLALSLMLPCSLAAQAENPAQLYQSILTKTIDTLEKQGITLWGDQVVVTDARTAPQHLDQGETNLKVVGPIDNELLTRISEALMKNEDRKQLVRLDLSSTTGLVMIHRNAFREEAKLGSIVLPEGVISMERDAFLYTDHLIEAILPNSMVDANGNAFNETMITKMVLPATTKWFGFRFLSSKTDCIVVLADGRTSVAINGFAAPSNRTGAPAGKVDVHRTFVFPPSLAEISVVDFDSGSLVDEIYSYAKRPPKYSGGSTMAFPFATTIYVPSSSLKTYQKEWASLTNATFKALPKGFTSFDAW